VQPPACWRTWSYLRGRQGAIEQGWPLWVRWCGGAPCWVWCERILSNESRSARSRLALPNPAVVPRQLDRNPAAASMSLVDMIATDERLNDLNWFGAARLDPNPWPMVSDPPGRREGPQQVRLQARHRTWRNAPVQGLLLAAWIADRLGAFF